LCATIVLQSSTMATKTLNIRIPEEQYEEMEEVVKARHYTSKGEFIRELLREALDEYIEQLHAGVEKERNKYMSLREYGKKEDLE